MNFTSFSEILEGFKTFLYQKGGERQGTYDMYFPKIRDTFIPYIEDQYGQNKFQDIKTFLESAIIVKDIKNCVINDVNRIYNNQNYASVLSVENFLISIKQFFFYLENNGIYNRTIISLFSNSPKQSKILSNVKRDINQQLLQCGIILRKPQPDPPVSKDEAEYILKYMLDKDIAWDSLNLLKKFDYNKLQYIIIIELFLLLGLKPKKMHALRLSSYDEKYKKLYISGELNSENLYAIILPDVLHDQIKYLKKHRGHPNSIRSDYLFTRFSGKKIDEGFIHHFLKSICSSYIFDCNKDASNYMDGYNSFTPTGLMKYGIIKQIEEGINAYVIRDLTGVEKDIYQVCEQAVFEELDNGSTHFNSKIINIDIYKQLNKL